MGEFGTRVLAGCLSALGALLWLIAGLLALVVIKAYFIADPMAQTYQFALLASGFFVAGFAARWLAKKVAAMVR